MSCDCVATSVIMAGWTIRVRYKSAPGQRKEMLYGKKRDHNRKKFLAI